MSLTRLVISLSLLAETGSRRLLICRLLGGEKSPSNDRQKVFGAAAVRPGLQERTYLCSTVNRHASQMYADLLQQA